MPVRVINKETDMERKNFEMTEADLEKILDACKPVPPTARNKPR